jgi:hypothetical protein
MTRCERRRGVRSPVRLALWIGLGLGLAHGTPLAAQSALAVAKERAEFLKWLATSPVSPFRAVAQAPLGGGLTLGPPGSDVPLAGVPRHRVTESSGKLTLEGSGAPRPLARGKALPLGRYTVVASGRPGRSVLTVFEKDATGRPVQYFPYDTSLSFVVRLDPPDAPGPVRLLGPDGVEVEAAEAGSVTVLVGRTPAALTVRKLPTEGEESELEIFFRDDTSGNGSYPAGRFVSLLPVGEGTYRLDFNRARSPFCAYSTAYACPAPWPGNSLRARITAGEQYETSPAVR